MARDYKEEYRRWDKARKSTPKERQKTRNRMRARYKMEKAGLVHKGDGKDVDHINRNTNDNSRSNLRIVSQKKNRGWKRGKTNPK